MKVLLVSFETFLTSGAGLATYTRHAVAAHLAAGHKVHLLTAALWNDYRKPRFTAPGFSSTILTDKELNSYYTRTNVNMRAPEATAVSDAAEKIAREWGCDVVEGTDYLFPLQPLAARKRAGMLGEFPPIVVMNHGMHRDFTAVAAVLPPESLLRTMACEEQALQWADGVMAPSQFAFEKMSALRGSRENVFLVREPFPGRPSCSASLNAGVFLHFGRLTLAKGVDRFVYLLNTLYGFHDMRRILFIGGEPDTAFPKKAVRVYIKRKLHPDLHKILHFHGPQEAEEARILVSQAGFHANLSRSETFSYATLETLFAGVLPLVEAGTPMAEFLPEEMRPGLLTPRALHDGGLPRVMKFWTSGDYEGRIRAIQEYAGGLVAPERFAREYENMVDQLHRPAVKKAKVPAEKPYTSEDVSVLISCHNDAELLNTALRSIRSQTQPVAEVVVFDDGSHDPRHIEQMKTIETAPRVTVMHSTNVGLVAARRRLMERAHTRLVIFLDADDYLEAEYVERTLAVLNHQPDCAAVLTHRLNFGLNNDVNTDFLLGTSYHWLINDFRMTALLKADAVRSIGFDPEVKNGEADDWIFWLRFTVRGFQALPCPLPLFRYRTALGSMSWPWSEGHAATTLHELAKVIDQARAEGYDLGEAAKVLMLGAMRRGWDLSLATSGEAAFLSSLARQLRSDRWLLLGGILGQAGVLRESLADATADMDTILNHMRDSRWMKIGRLLHLSRRLPKHASEVER
jgi:glycosyltransferase involved in cell wall biosynthesis